MRRLPIIGVLAFGLGACGGESPTTQAPAGNSPNGPAAVKTDFSLPDVNPTSGTHMMSVSPRDQLQKISGWYFGHST